MTLLHQSINNIYIYVKCSLIIVNAESVLLSSFSYFCICLYFCVFNQEKCKVVWQKPNAKQLQEILYFCWFDLESFDVWKQYTEVFLFHCSRFIYTLGALHCVTHSCKWHTVSGGKIVWIQTNHVCAMPEILSIVFSINWSKGGHWLPSEMIRARNSFIIDSKYKACQMAILCHQKFILSFRFL